MLPEERRQPVPSWVTGYSDFFISTKPGAVVFTFTGTVLQRCEVSVVGDIVKWHPSHYGPGGIGARYREAVERAVRHINNPEH